MPPPSPFPQGGALEEETEAWGDDRSGGVVLLRGEYSLARCVRGNDVVAGCTRSAQFMLMRYLARLDKF